MNIKVSDLMNLDSFSSAEITAGTSGLDRRVENISALEDTDHIRDMKNGEFLLSSLYRICHMEFRIEDIIGCLSKMGISGLGIIVNRHTEAIPEIFIEQANELSFPLIILPESINFSAQINDFLRYKNELNSSELQYLNSIHNILLDIMLKGGDEDELCRSLALLLNKNIMLLNLSFEILSDYKLDGRYETAFWLDEKSFDKKTFDDVNFISFNQKNIKSYIYSVQFGFEKIGYIVVYLNKDFVLSSKDKIAIERYAAVFTINIQKNKTVAEIEKRYHEEFAIDLILKKIKLGSTAVIRAKKLGWNLIFPLSMIIADVIDFASNDKYSIIEAITKKLRSGLITEKEIYSGIFISSYEQYLIVFINRLYVDRISKICQSITSALIESRVERYYIGVTKNVNQLSEIPKRYEEGKLTVKIARNINSLEPLYFKDIGIYRIIDSISNKTEAKEFCMDMLGNVIRYDEINKTDLVNTLICIINEDGNLKNAAAKMFLHYNTIRYRYRKLEELLDRKLAGLVSYVDIYIAVKIYETIK